jgi:group I intron endonuclease
MAEPTISSTAGGIYRIRNLVDGKFYIGSTNRIKRRWIDHKAKLRRNRHCNSYLQHAWNKHGEDAFVFEVIVAIESPTDEQLFEQEQWHLDNTLCLNPEHGYNLSMSADKSGCNHGPATREKMRLAHLGEKNHFFGRTHSGESISRMSESKRGHKDSDVTRLKKSLARRGEKNPAYGKGEMFAGERNHFWGKKHTPETLAKLPLFKKGDVSKFKGHHHTEENKRKFAERQRGKKASPETRRKLSEAHKGKPNAGAFKPVMRTVIQLKDGVEIGRFKCLPSAAALSGVTYGDIWKCCKGRAKTARGFQFMYELQEGGL